MSRGVLAALGFVASVGPFATDMYLASLPEMAASLGVSASTVQLTLTAFMIGMMIGQLTFGPLSDRFGRRRVMLVALAAFALVSIAVAFSPTAGFLIAGRFLQGVTGSAGVVIARAVAADLTTGAATMRALSLMSTLGSIAVIVAPLVGSVLASVTDWRGVLGALAAVTVAMFVLAALVIPESLPAENRLHGGVRSIATGFIRLLGDRVFLAHAFSLWFGFAMLMSYVSASSFVVQKTLGLGPLAYGMSFTAGAVAMLGANLLNARLSGRVAPARMRAVGVLCGVSGGAGLLAQTLTGVLTIAGFIACAVLISASIGFILANATTLALSRADHARGTGSALLGGGQFLLGAIASPIVGLWGEETAVPMAVCVTVAALLAGVASRASR